METTKLVNENLTNHELGQAGELTESSFVRIAHKTRKFSTQFGWPILLLIYLLPARVPLFQGDGLPYFLFIGLVPMLTGLGLRLWARGYYRKEGFVLDGPYRYVRNPVELGALLAFLGAHIIAGIDWVYIMPSMAMAWLYLSFSASAYESDILRKVGGPYLRYCKRVGRWIPNLLPGTNRTQRTYSVMHAMRAERDSLIWLMAYLVVFAARQRLPRPW